MSYQSILKPDWPQLPSSFGALTTLRTGGVSTTPYDDGFGLGGFNLGDHVGDQPEHVARNRALLAEFLPDFLPDTPQWLSQIHGTTVLNLDEKQSSLTADACITSKPGTVCAVLTADCLPVLLCDVRHRVVGAAHAGWRGLADGVLENTIAAMQKSGAIASHIVAWLGPAIGPLKFDVGEEVVARFIEEDASAATAFKVSLSKPGRCYADIYQLARLRLYGAGVRQISGGEFCTVSSPEKFYSYRRDGATGRMASLIWIKWS